MYRRSYRYHQWPNPMHDNWNHNIRDHSNWNYYNWNHTCNPHDDNRNHDHGEHSIRNPYAEPYTGYYNPYAGYDHPHAGRQRVHEIKDHGSEPFVVDIERVTKQNKTFRTALWTGEHLQLTLMSIDVGEDIGLEVHPHLDQFLRLEQGQGLVQMGDSRHHLDFQAHVYPGYAIFVPAGKWHNLTNTGQRPIKLYSIYAPPEHPFGTVHETKADAMAAEEHHHHP
jgi:mannose-6-phosphate isomerase-like protein (cupin superfamily)